MNQTQQRFFDEAVEAHNELAKCLQRLRGALGNRSSAQRAVSVAITEAETSFLWLSTVPVRAGADAPSRGPAQAAPAPGTCHCPAGLGAYLCAQCWPQ